MVKDHIKLFKVCEAIKTGVKKPCDLEWDSETFENHLPLSTMQTKIEKILEKVHKDLDTFELTHGRHTRRTVTLQLTSIDLKIKISKSEEELTT